MWTLLSLYALCVWMSLVGTAEGTSFVYHFPSITVQRQRIKSEQSGSSGPPGTGPRTQLRWAHVRRFGLICAKLSVRDVLFNTVHGYFNVFIISLNQLFFICCCCRNWCQYTVSKTVSCQVHNGTETTVQRVLQGCRWPGPCTKVVR